MPVNLPASFHTWAIADKSGLTPVGGNKKKAWHGIDAIPKTLPPLIDDICR